MVDILDRDLTDEEFRQFLLVDDDDFDIKDISKLDDNTYIDDEELQELLKIESKEEV